MALCKLLYDNYIINRNPAKLGGDEIGLIKWVAVGAAVVVAGPIVLPLLAIGNCDGIDGGCGGCDE
tara:strand:+ start:232 stop:429 length:198 start_codon:yes stop_codon:yes gene_type:complete